jgi:hypothetical protein
VTVIVCGLVEPVPELVGDGVCAATIAMETTSPQYTASRFCMITPSHYDESPSLFENDVL